MQIVAAAKRPVLISNHVRHEACKLVKYCSRDCQIAHRPQHKRVCKKRVAELHDEKLFKQPPPEEDCPICMIRLPALPTGSTYMVCCGKIVCSGCIHTFQLRSKGPTLCPFCRTPAHKSDEELLKRFENRVKLNDAAAIIDLGTFYDHGRHGLPQSRAKALELWHQAGKFGHADANCYIASAYMTGDGLERDEKKALHYYKLAALGGHSMSRHNLGSIEGRVGNHDRALKHYMIAVKGGNPDSLESIKGMLYRGHASKDDYANALRSYQAYVDEIKNDQRDVAAAARDDGLSYYGSAAV